MECTYCAQPATWIVTGIVECGSEDGRADNPVCDAHKAEFEAWNEAGAAESLYGFVVLLDIKPYR